MKKSNIGQQLIRVNFSAGLDPLPEDFKKARKEL